MLFLEVTTEVTPDFTTEATTEQTSIPSTEFTTGMWNHLGMFLCFQEFVMHEICCF